jgi:hypothetical protein
MTNAFLGLFIMAAALAGLLDASWGVVPALAVPLVLCLGIRVPRIKAVQFAEEGSGIGSFTAALLLACFWLSVAFSLGQFISWTLMSPSVTQPTFKAGIPRGHLGTQNHLPTKTLSSYPPDR